MDSVCNVFLNIFQIKTDLVSYNANYHAKLVLSINPTSVRYVSKDIIYKLMVLVVNLSAVINI